jgi:hypothetical protein
MAVVNGMSDEPKKRSRAWIGWAPLAAAFRRAFSVATSDASRPSALPPEPGTVKVASDPDRVDVAHFKVNNEMALIGFMLALFSISCGMPLGFPQVIGIAFSYIGLHTFDPVTEKNKWQAGVGLVINILALMEFLIYFTGRMRHAG